MYTRLFAIYFLKPCDFIVKSPRCALAATLEDQFVAFEGSMQLYTELLNHRPPSGAWQVATAGCSGLARIFARAQVIALMHVQMLACHHTAVFLPSIAMCGVSETARAASGLLRFTSASISPAATVSTIGRTQTSSIVNTFLFTPCANPVWLG